MKLGFWDYALVWALIGSIVFPLSLLIDKLGGKRLFIKLGLLDEEEK